MDESALQRSALIAISVTSFTTPLMLAAVNVALPAIGAAFDADAVLLSWVATAYLLAGAVFLLPFGKVADIVGRKRIFLIGMFVIMLASVCAAMAQSMTVLLIFRVLQGVGSAMLFATGLAILTSVIPPPARGKAFGLAVAAVYIGLTCGPAIGGWVTEHLGWRAVMVFHLPLYLISICLVMTRLKSEWRGQPGQRLDLAGSIIYAVSICAVMYGVSILPTVPSIGIILGGVIGLLVFLKFETSRTHPVLEVGLFRNNPVFTFSCLAIFLMYSATFATSFLMSLYLQYVKGMSPQQAGLVMMAQPIVMALFSPLAGRLSDTYEPRYLASLGMGLTAFGLGLLALLQADTSVAYLICALMLSGLGFAMFTAPNANAIMSAVDPHHYGSATGTMGTLRVLGQMFSMGIVTLIFALMLGHVQITPANYAALIRSVNWVLMINACLCILGIYFSISRGVMQRVVVSALEEPDAGN